MTGWLLSVLGVTNEAGHWYAFWSGFGSDVGEVAIIGGLIDLARRMIRHHSQLLAQAAQHHREHLDQQQRHHEDLKKHLAAASGLTSAVPVPKRLLDDIKKAPKPSAVVPQKLAGIKPEGDQM